MSTEDNINTRTGAGIVKDRTYDPIELNQTLAILNPKEIEYFSFKLVLIKSFGVTSYIILLL
jgi:hypothetical protein